MLALLMSYITGPNNPCGNGIRPTKCTCPNGKKYTPVARSVFINSALLSLTSLSRIVATVPCGSGDAIPNCACPDGKKFHPPKSLMKKMAEGSGKDYSGCPGDVTTHY